MADRRLMTKPRPIQEHHSLADLIWPDGPFNKYKKSKIVAYRKNLMLDVK
jgi:hypothetical protein